MRKSGWAVQPRSFSFSLSAFKAQTQTDNEDTGAAAVPSPTPVLWHVYDVAWHGTAFGGGGRGRRCRFTVAEGHF